ncbi:MAG: hypothetical protein GY803_26540 [Chloroflexi bacterium]|nr:hypothetical protein [Chloroflexota bacterium]
MMNYDTKNLRNFLRQRFDDSELSQFCFDHFLEVYQDFSDTWSKSDKIQRLLEYCLAHGRIPDLLAALEQERPSVFPDYFPPPPSTKKQSVAKKQGRLENVPVWAWAGGVILALVFLFVLSQLSDQGTAPTDLGETTAVSTADPQTNQSEQLPRISTSGDDDIDGWPVLHESQYLQGEIKLGETIAMPRWGPGNTSHTWLFRDGPATVDIILESEDKIDHRLYVYNEKSQNWDDAMPGGYADERTEPGEQLLAFDIPDDGDYIIAVRASRREIASQYQLTVQVSR